VLMAIARWEPDYAAKNQELLKGLALADEHALYAVLTALDFVALGRNVETLLGRGSPNGWKSTEAAERAGRLHAAARDELFRGLRRLSARKAGPALGEVGRRVLRAAFGDYLFAEQDPAALEATTPYDVFRAGAPVTFSGAEPGRFPPWARPDELVRFSGGLKIEEILSRGDRPLFDAADSRAAGDEELEDEIERERGRLARRPPPDAESSWIL